MNRLHSGAWNDVSKADWYRVPYDYSMVNSGKCIGINDSYEDEFSEGEEKNRETSQDINVTIDMKINININDNTNNTTADNTSITITDKEFPNKRELYKHYRMDITIIQKGYEVTMRCIKTQGKIGPLYKLAKK